MSYPNFPRKSFDDVLDSRILIVDDQETNVRLLEYLLHRNGYRSVRGATDPRAVVEIYKEFCPDLVLLDLVMPHMDGVELMEQLQKVKRETYPSIIIISASENDEAQIRSLALGTIGFLAKPFNRVEVVGRIEDMLKAQPVSRPINH
jgi:PleD family two-component response regulator